MAISVRGCVFCDIVSGKAPSSKVYRDDHVIAFLDIQPINPGHLMIVPIAHVPDLAALREEDGRQLFAVAQRVTSALYRSGLRCEGVNFFLADGDVAGQEVFHVHLHLIPRYRRDGFGLKLPRRYYRRPPVRELDAAAEAIRNALGIEPSGQIPSLAMQRTKLDGKAAR